MPVNPLELLLQRQRKPGLMPSDVPPPGDVNASAGLYGFQGALGSEARERRRQAMKAGAPTGEINALGDLVNEMDQEQAASPIAAQQKDYTARLADLTSATSEGFGLGPQSPVQDVDPVRARNIYKRQQEQEAMRQPITEREMIERGSTQREQIKAKGDLDVADRNAQALSDRENNFTELAQTLQAQGVDLSNIRFPSRTGGGGLGIQRPQAAPNQSGQFRQMNQIRQNLAASGVKDVFLDYFDPTPQQAAYNSAASAFLAQATTLPQEAKEDLTSLLVDRQNAGLTNKQIIEKLPIDLSQLSGQEFNDLMDVLTKMRGAR